MSTLAGHFGEFIRPHTLDSLARHSSFEELANSRSSGSLHAGTYQIDDRLRSIHILPEDLV